MEPDRPSWYRPASGIPAGGFERKASRTRTPGRAVHPGDRGIEDPGTGPHPSRKRSAETGGELVQGWVDWLMPKGPQVFGTVNTRYPLSMAQHERVGRRLQLLYARGCGETPSVLVAVQENPTREGYHAHPMILGTAALLDVRRRDVWSQLRAELRLQHGAGQQWSDAGGGFDPHGGAFYRHPVSAADAYNSARIRLEPVKTPNDVMGYATRYGVRMGDGLIVLVGDRWGGDVVLT
jgi:hypothetical protein